MMTQPVRHGVCISCHPHFPPASPALTVLDGDLALPVIHPQHGLILSPPLSHNANLPLAVVTVIGWVLAQG